MSNPYRNALVELYTWANEHCSRYQKTADVMHRTRVLLTQPELPELTDPARFAAWLRKHSSDCMELGRPDWAHMISRAAELLEQHPTPPHPTHHE